MKKLLWIILGAATVAVVCGLANFKGLPLSMSMQAKEALSDNHDETEWLFFDTVMVVDGNVIGWGGSDLPAKVMINGEVVCDNPLVRMDSVSPSACRLRMITRQADFDLTDKDVMARIRQFNKPLDGFTRFQKDYVEHFDSMVDDKGQLLRQNTIYSFTLDYPDEDLPQRGPVMRWLADLISIAQDMDVDVPPYTALYIGYNRSQSDGQIYAGDATDIERLAEFATNKTFAEWRDQEGSIFDISIVTDYRAHIANDRYITYGAFVQSNQGPGHGMYTENFYTYDLNANKMVNNDYLFREGSMDAVKKLLLAELAKDDTYRYYNSGVETAEDVEERIRAWNSVPITDTQSGFEMPQGALTQDGVVFSFQPYQIDCYAAGAFHITVPYAKLQPYLTAAAQNLIKLQ